jgi:hypothetical protein
MLQLPGTPQAIHHSLGEAMHNKQQDNSKYISTL